ncbi:N-alpha-acetyltransferase 20-like [Papaver somniferum]|uniref:N-alpha-acetyltransferase 20-like n=1 Tax=Papaver somniferum TaxID=3469 RepID=UPI000E704FD2|nr:N-alpha-acetyltransferase 20-like [Papaver somniferum]
MGRPLSDYMSTMSEYPEYSLVAVAPGNQIEGYITAINVGEGLEKHCEIKEMHYLRGDMAEMLLKTVEETADNMHNVYYLEVDLHSDNQKYLELFNKVGYTCSKEYYDVIRGDLSSRNTCPVEACISWQKLQQPVLASKTGLSVPSSTSPSDVITDGDMHIHLNSDSGIQKYMINSTSK